MKVVIGVAGKGQRRKTSHLCRNANLFLQLADQRFFRGFTLFNLAAGKLPETGQRLSFWTLGQKHASISIHKRAGRNQHDTAGFSLTHFSLLSR
ncbi:hypothetical protein FQZ97_874740 [compost metagenome]